MSAIMRLYEDVLSNGAAASITFAALPRLILVVHGSATIAGRAVGGGEAWHGEGAVAVGPGPAGTTLWRFELAPEGAADGDLSGISRLKLAAPVKTLPDGDLLLRGDSVAFPPGGCAYRHRHQGPGIRCLIEGSIRIDTAGHSTSYGPGGAWYESGPEPVFAQAASDRATRFVRMMILPRALVGKNSIQYLDPQDKDRPKSQSYQIFADVPIAFQAARRP
jgi:hypothetical protein